MNLRILRSQEVALISDFLFDLYAPVRAEEFGEHLVNVCATHLRDFAHTTAYDETRRSDRAYHIHCNRMDEMREFDDPVRSHISDNPSWRYAMKGGTERVLKITDFISQREFRRTALYQEAFKPMRCDYQFAVTVLTPTHIGGLTLHRDRPISELMRPLLQILAPHIERAQGLAQRSETPERNLRPKDLMTHGLTAREAEILVWIIQGKRDSEIAIILGIASKTVSKHVERILAKLGVETRGAAVAAVVKVALPTGI